MAGRTPRETKHDVLRETQAGQDVAPMLHVDLLNAISASVIVTAIYKVLSFRDPGDSLAILLEKLACLDWQLFSLEIVVIALVITLGRRCALVLLAPLAIVSSIYCLDVATEIATGQRFDMAGIPFAMSFPQATVEMVPWRVLAGIVGTSCCVLAVSTFGKRLRWVLLSIFLLVSIALSIVGVFGVRASTLPDRTGEFSLAYLKWATDGVVSNSYTKAYSAIEESLAKREIGRLVSIDGSRFPRRTVVLILESLSSYHSKLVSGLNDFTPWFDALSAEGKLFPNVFAAGPNTNWGMAALLTGLPIVPAPGFEKNPHYILRPYARYSFVLNGIHAAGIRTLFFSGYRNNVATVTRGDLQRLGVQEVRYPPFDSRPSNINISVSDGTDRNLYDYTLKRIAQLKSEKASFLLFVEPAAGHAIWQSREQPQRVLDGMGADVLAFVDELKRSDFFDDGLLVITSDQRDASRLSSREIAHYGDSAPFRIPLLLLGHGAPPGVVDYRCVGQSQLLQRLPDMLSCCDPLASAIIGAPKLKSPEIYLFDTEWDPLCRKAIPLSLSGREISAPPDVKRDINGVVRDLNTVRAWLQRTRPMRAPQQKWANPTSNPPRPLS